MKRTGQVWIVGACVLIVIVFVYTAIGPREESPSQNPMAAKLGAAHSILNALAVQDFRELSRSTETLLALARQQWVREESPEYRAYLKNFWTVLEGLQSAADEKDIDRATAAFNQMTVSCVSCHAHLRDHVQ
jgi:cytochrome c556